MTTHGTRDFQGTQFLDTLGGLPISTVLPPANMPAKVEAFIQDTLAFWQTERVGPGPTGMQWVPKGGPGIVPLFPATKYSVNLPGVQPLTQYTSVTQAILAAKADRAAQSPPRTLAQQPVCIFVYPGAHAGYVSEAGVHVYGCASDQCGCTVFINFDDFASPAVTFDASQPVPLGNLSNTSSLINAAVYSVSDKPAIRVTGGENLRVFMNSLVIRSFTGMYTPPAGPAIMLGGTGLCVHLDGVPNPEKTVLMRMCTLATHTFPMGLPASQPALRGDTEYAGNPGTDTPGLVLSDCDLSTTGANMAAMDFIGSVRGNRTRVLGRIKVSRGALSKPAAEFTDLEQLAFDQSQAAIQISGVDLLVRDSRVFHTPAISTGLTYEAVAGLDNSITILDVTAGPTVLGGVAGKRIGALAPAVVASVTDHTIRQYSELRVTVPVVKMEEPFDLVVMDTGSGLLTLPPIANMPAGTRIAVYNFTIGLVTVETALGNTFFGGSISETPAAKERLILQSPASGTEWWTLSDDP